MAKKSKKKGQGEGNIRQRSDGRWEARYTYGRDDDGKQVQRSVYGKTRAEVRDKLLVVLSNINDGTYVEPHDITLGEWMTHWLETHKKMTLRQSTYESYESIIRLHIQPYVGNIPLIKLKPADLQKLYKTLLEEGRVGQHDRKVDRPPAPIRLTKDGRPFKPGPKPKEKPIKEEPDGLSVCSVRYTHKLIHSALKQALKENLIKTLPTLACSLPRQERKEMQILPVETIPRFLEAARQSRYYTLYYMALVTGMRRGEYLGLRWSDIDFEKMTMSISKQLKRENGDLKLLPLKTTHSNRKIAIPKELVNELKRHKRKQAEEKLAAGSAWQENDLVFCGVLGTPLDPRAFYANYKRMLANANLPDIRFHDLRHTYATLAIQNGVDVKTVQETLGHHSPAFTLEVYTHVTDKMRKDAARKMGAMMKSFEQK